MDSQTLIDFLQMKKIANPIQRALVGNFEGSTPEEWEAHIKKRQWARDAMLGAVTGTGGALGGALIGSRYGHPALGAGIGALAWGLPATALGMYAGRREAANTTPGEWRQGFEAYKRRYPERVKEPKTAMDSQTLIDFLQPKTAAVGPAIGSFLKRHAGKGLLAGGGMVAGGMGHRKLVQMGQKSQQEQAEAEELSQLLQAYPELMYEVPGAYGMSYDGDEQQQMPDFPF